MPLKPTLTRGEKVDTFVLDKADNAHDKNKEAGKHKLHRERGLLIHSAMCFKKHKGGNEPDQNNDNPKLAVAESRKGGG